MTTTKQIGNVGENVATDLLTAAGYAIVERNARVGNVEVDIIARCHNRLIIVEVKTRKDDHIDTNYGIDSAKLRRLARAGSNYVRSRNLPLEVQIDVVLITTHPDGTYSTEHIPDICLPPFRRR